MMKALLILTIILSFVSCNKPQKSGLKTEVVEIEIQDTVKKTADKTQEFKNDNSWQQGFGLTHDIDKDSIWSKPVRFYIENKNCSQLAKDFYFGTKRPTDDEDTEKLLKLVILDDKNLRPFYRWILNKTILIQDGALAEYTGVPARQYAEKFPNEFFEYMDFDKTEGKYHDWCNSILYSGFYDSDDWKKPSIIRQNMIIVMTKNCLNYDKNYKTRIEKFANDCFPNSREN
jgi:hypothetical protein